MPCRYKAASYTELEQRIDRQEKLRSIASEMSHKKALMVSNTVAEPVLKRIYEIRSNNHILLQQHHHASCSQFWASR